MPFIERYLGGIIRVETTIQEEQEEAARRREQIPYEDPFFFVAGPPAEMIRGRRIRTLFLFGVPVIFRINYSLILDNLPLIVVNITD